MSVSKVLVAVTPARRGLPSSPQQNFLAVELYTSLVRRVSSPIRDCAVLTFCLNLLTVSRVSTMTHWRNVSQG